MGGCTFRESSFLSFILSHVLLEVSSWGKESAPVGAGSSLWEWTLCERAVLSWKAHRKSHGLFPFVERIENYGNVSVPRKGLVETGIYKIGIPLLLPCCAGTYPIFQCFDTF